MGGTIPALYLNMGGVREFFEQVKEKMDVVRPLEKMDYGQTEFGVRDLDGCTLAFAETEME
jgi:hypothetical protein